MKHLAIIVAKMAIRIGKLLKRGSVLPGRLASKIDKKIMYKLELPNLVIAVTGSSGKGGTTSLVAESLRSNGYKVAHNISGSNLNDGILTTLLECSNLNGKLKVDAVVLECDERYVKYVFPAVKPNYVVVTNITRDQPPRHGNFDLVYEEIRKGLTNDMHLILNADDPYMQKFALEFDNITYYGIDKNKYVTKTPLFENLNLVYCPKCHHKLTYKYYHFENIGFYECKCGLKHPNSKFNVTHIDYDNKEIIINGNIVKIDMPLLYCIYNTLAAYSILSMIGIDEERVSELINENQKENLKQYNSLKMNDRLVYILNNKNENSTSFNQSLLLVNRDKGIKTLVIGWKEISRRYEFNDLSWLYDISFEIFKDKDIKNVLCVGIQKYDIATRIKIAGIDQNKIKCFDNLEEATIFLKNETKENIYAILNFDYVEPFTKLVEEGNND